MKAGLLLTLALTGCSRSVVGEYACTGFAIDTLKLEADGTYTAHGEIMSHAQHTTGHYTVTKDKVTVSGTTTTEGLAETIPDQLEYDRVGSRELKAEIVDCKRK